jgi:hypothetical protein
LGSKAVEVLLEDVYVTVEPRTDFTVDEVPSTLLFSPLQSVFVGCNGDEPNIENT